MESRHLLAGQAAKERERYRNYRNQSDKSIHCALLTEPFRFYNPAGSVFQLPGKR